MTQNKKFIVVKDKTTAEKFLTSGFQLVNKVSDTWTFINSVPANFCFDEIDKKKFIYTNKFSL